MKKQITISAAKLKKQLPKVRRPFAPKTRVVKSKKVYHRRYTDGHGDGDFDE